MAQIDCVPSIGLNFLSVVDLEKKMMNRYLYFFLIGKIYRHLYAIRHVRDKGDKTINIKYDR